MTDSQTTDGQTTDGMGTEMAEATNPAAGGAAATDRDLEMRVIDTLRDVYDPEIPVNIYELGLIYNVAAGTDGLVEVVMTLTTPHCPVAETIGRRSRPACAAWKGSATSGSTWSGSPPGRRR